MSLMDEELFKAKRKVSSIRKMGKSHEQIVHRERNKTSLKHTKRSWISFGIREMQKNIYIYILSGDYIIPLSFWQKLQNSAILSVRLWGNSMLLLCYSQCKVVQLLQKGIWQHLPKLYRNHGLKMYPSEIAGHMQNGVYTIVGTIPKVDKNVSLS